MSDFAEFLAIREMYAHVLPKWMADYRATGRMFNDPYLTDWKFSPIESSVWADLRYACLPFYPQIPVLNYFIDFGCPFLKIGIECDGAQWHDKERDAIRDAKLSAEGWTIYRIPGHECKRSVNLDDFQERNEHQERDMVARYCMDTSEGLIEAIGVHHFGKPAKDERDLAYASTLAKHMTAGGWQ